MRALALVAGYVTFLHAFVVTLVVLKNLVQPRLRVGKSQVGATRGFLAWGLNSVFQGLFIAAPFHDQVHFLFWLRFLYYRGMGMRLHPSVVLGTGAVLRQVELIRVGKGSVIGIGAALSCHVNVDGKTHQQAAVSIGERVLIGAHTSIGPGVSVGDGSVVGYRSTLSVGVSLDPGAVLGAEVFVKNNVHIGAGAVDNNATVVSQRSLNRPQMAGRRASASRIRRRASDRLWARASIGAAEAGGRDSGQPQNPWRYEHTCLS